MGLIELLVFLIIVGVLLYLVGLIPMDEKVRKIIQVVVVVALLLWLLRAFGFADYRFEPGWTGTRTTTIKTEQK